MPGALPGPEETLIDEVRLRGVDANPLEQVERLPVALGAVEHEGGAPVGLVAHRTVRVLVHQLPEQVAGAGVVAAALGRLGRLPQGLVGEFVPGVLGRQPREGDDGLLVAVEAHLDPARLVEAVGVGGPLIALPGGAGHRRREGEGVGTGPLPLGRGTSAARVVRLPRRRRLLRGPVRRPQGEAGLHQQRPREEHPGQGDPGHGSELLLPLSRWPIHGHAPRSRLRRVPGRLLHRPLQLAEGVTDALETGPDLAVEFLELSIDPLSRPWIFLASPPIHLSWRRLSLPGGVRFPRPGLAKPMPPPGDGPDRTRKEVLSCCFTVI